MTETAGPTGHFQGAKRTPARINGGARAITAIVLLLLAALCPASAGTVDGETTTVEIVYEIEGAARVYLVWGIGNWQPVDGKLRPSGTFLKGNVLHTSLSWIGDRYRGELKIPAGRTIKYGFLVEKAKPRSERDRFLWDGEYQARAGPIHRSTTIWLIESLSFLKFTGWTALVVVAGLGVFILAARLLRRSVSARYVTSRYAVIVVPVALLMIAAEGYLQFSDAAGLRIASPARYHPPRDGLVTDGALGWVAGREASDVNDQGFRDSKDFLEPRASVDRRRVMLLGGSSAWGVGVDAAQNAASQLQLALGGAYEVFNLGVPHFSIGQMYASYERYKRFINPDVVVVIFTDADVLGDLDGKKPTFRLDGETLKMRNHLTGVEESANAVADASKLAGQVLVETYYAPLAYRVAARELSAISSDVQSNGGRFLAFRVPASTTGASPSSIWARYFGLSTLQSGGQLSIEDSERQLAAEPRSKGESFRAEEGEHSTPAFNRMVARIVAGRLASINTDALRLSRSTKQQNVFRNVARTFRYVGTGLDGHVFLVWGINGWNVPEETFRPADSTNINGLVQSPMKRTPDGFEVELTLPSGTFVDYNYKIVDDAGRLIGYDNNGDADYHQLF